MEGSGAHRIENLTRQDLARRLRGIAREHFPGEGVDRRELAHLVQVVTNEALFLSDLYARAALGEILDRRPVDLPPSIRTLLERFTGNEEPRTFDVRRLPERIKVVGDKCLLDVGLIGQNDYRGIPLISLGQRSYMVAANLLARLAEDPLLGQYFRDNRLANLSIEDEIAFLQQCSHRFELYSRMLKLLGVDEGQPAESAAPAPSRIDTGPPPGVQIPTMESSEDAPDPSGDALVAPLRAPAAAAATAERLLLTQNELLAAYERILLFSALDLEALKQRLGDILVGQPEAIGALCDEFSLYAAGTQNLNRPPSYLFVGPTGVGKNYLVETLRDLLEAAWDVEIPFLTLEGPNYTYPSDINELRGATRGFIRSDEEGLLTEFHRRATGAPLSVILIDEVEKAHPQLRKFFLSIMDRGTVTDNRGQELHFANSMVIYTSNIGYSDLAQAASPIGYGNQEAQDRRVAQDVRRDLRRTLSPEFINRLRVVHFNYLDAAAIDKVFDLELARIVERFREVHGLGIEMTPAARTEILKRGYSHDHGARHLRAHLETLVNVEISRKIKRDESRYRPGSNRVLRYLRQLKAGKRKFDLNDVRNRVIRQARARVNYRRVLMDFRDGEFSYAGMARPS